ncbi:MAG: glycosyltransferase [Lachnospiraceae bacterium]|nr:glycosyltransferase [Lachnospiraceae bacterium]MDD7051457.1 glycosyltransferase [Lachnospiraceae bacterium]MDY4096040.1 glycosyltransferase [Lachnospiraceae bacterium]
MQEKFFSIIVVALNPGEKLKKTLDSIVGQNFADYEVILKDGGSRDRSLEELENNGFLARYPQIRVVREADKGIYDAMNQAVRLAAGRYIQFLNCGDYLYNENVLEQVAGYIRATENIGKKAGIYYGNQYNRLQKAEVHSAPEINDFTCYRNVPCHQVCFYAGELFKERGYKTEYWVRADYEHFLYCIYEKKQKAVFLPLLIASYEGGGFSETAENRRRSAKEHREITLRYLGAKKVCRYRLIMWLTLAPLRGRLAESPAFSGMYNKVKMGIYRLFAKKVKD